MSDLSLHRRAVIYWGDALTALMYEAEPDSEMFGECLSAITRAKITGFDPLLAGADIQSVCKEKDVSIGGLAERLQVPYAWAYAVYYGWKALPLRSLLLVAAALNTPVGAFIHDAGFYHRFRVRIHHQWQEAEQNDDVTHL